LILWIREMRKKEGQQSLSDGGDEFKDPTPPIPPDDDSLQAPKDLPTAVTTSDPLTRDPAAVASAPSGSTPAEGDSQHQIEKKGLFVL
jgi:hypothetical protein